MGGNFLPGMEAIAAAYGAQAMIHRRRRGLRILLELMTDIVDERGFGDLGERLMLRLEPPGEVEQVVGVDAQRARGKLAQALGIEESVSPVQFSSVFIPQAVGGSTGTPGRLIDHRELHSDWAPSRQWMKSAALAP